MQRISNLGGLNRQDSKAKLSAGLSGITNIKKKSSASNSPSMLKQAVEKLTLKHRSSTKLRAGKASRSSETNVFVVRQNTKLKLHATTLSFKYTGDDLATSRRRQGCCLRFINGITQWIESLKSPLEMEFIRWHQVTASCCVVRQPLLHHHAWEGGEGRKVNTKCMLVRASPLLSSGYSSEHERHNNKKVRILEMRF